MKSKPTILAFNKYYLPGYRAGGPIRTLANMAERLGDDFCFRIVALDHDAGDPTPYLDVHRDCWRQFGKAQVMHLAPADVSLRQVSQLVALANPDAIYLNSFFDPVFTQRVLWARRLRCISKTPIIIAPRGEFSQGALGLKSLKKELYIRLTAATGLYRDLTWQASSIHERTDILCNLTFVAPTDIRVAMNLAPLGEIPTIEEHGRRIGEPLRVCFLSRISPMKNLDFALRALATTTAQVVFTIYGPQASRAYWATCEAIIANLPSNITVRYEGPLHPRDVRQQLSKHDLFFLPTRGENYGHVIHEALSSGLTLLISDQTPWLEINERGVGWALPLDNEGAFAQKIDEFSSWDNHLIASARRRAFEYARERSEKPEVIEANRDLFLTAIAQRSQAAGNLSSQKAGR